MYMIIDIEVERINEVSVDALIYVDNLKSK